MEDDTTIYTHPVYGQIEQLEDLQAISGWISVNYMYNKDECSSNATDGTMWKKQTENSSVSLRANL